MKKPSKNKKDRSAKHKSKLKVAILKSVVKTVMVMAVLLIIQTGHRDLGGVSKTIIARMFRLVRCWISQLSSSTQVCQR